jgi:hypothetical protein
VMLIHPTTLRQRTIPAARKIGEHQKPEKFQEPIA